MTTAANHASRTRGERRTRILPTESGSGKRAEKQPEPSRRIRAISGAAPAQALLAAGFAGFEDDPFELDDPASDLPEPDFPESECFESLLDSELPELEPFSPDFELPLSDSPPDRPDERLSVL